MAEWLLAVVALVTCRPVARAKVGVDEFRHRLVICFLGKSLRSHRTSVKLANEATVGVSLLLLISDISSFALPATSSQSILCFSGCNDSANLPKRSRICKYRSRSMLALALMIAQAFLFIEINTTRAGVF
jgi:hypothetical protein